MLISFYATSPKTAHYDFKYALSKSKGNSEPNLAYHLIQSFAPGEVSYQEAHRIGIELADKLLEEKYAYVIATHIDHNLSIIIPGPTKAKKYNEWLADKNGISWKTQLRNDMMSLLKKQEIMNSS